MFNKATYKPVYCSFEGETCVGPFRKNFQCYRACWWFVFIHLDIWVGACKNKFSRNSVYNVESCSHSSIRLLFFKLRPPTKQCNRDVILYFSKTTIQPKNTANMASFVVLRQPVTTLVTALDNPDTSTNDLKWLLPMFKWR